MKYDVIVAGGGPSGIAAALAAKRNNAKVLLIEKSGLLGGANVLSLVGPLMTFHNLKGQVVRGIGEEIVSRLVANGYSPGHRPDPVGFCATVTPYDVEGLKEVYFNLVYNEKIDLLLHAIAIDVTLRESKITAARAATKNGVIEFEADVYVDATGDGDIAAAAGCPFIYGRESDNLTQPMTMLFTVAGIDFEKLREYQNLNPGEFYGGKAAPADYFGLSGFFEKIAAARAAGDFTIPRDRVLLFENARRGEATVNITRVLNGAGTDPFALSRAEIEGRKQVKEAFAFLKKYIPGFENSYIIRTPYQIGVRETRHIKGQYTLIEEDIAGERAFEDSIAVAAFPIDIHSPDGSSLEASSQIKTYEIPLRVMIPEGPRNLIVTGRAVSATHEASASMRVSPVVMALGQAAGVLASYSALRGIEPGAAPYEEIAVLLRKGNAVLKKEDV
ncbi:MAG TPA: FAD-dependent oxidoreductase [Bacilli bacterium]|nr:FAD-dependent oxidoreductase [Bacilli bacterium]